MSGVVEVHDQPVQYSTLATSLHSISRMRLCSTRFEAGVCTGKRGVREGVEAKGK
jgi:hypothetical protein